MDKRNGIESSAFAARPTCPWTRRAWPRPRRRPRRIAAEWQPAAAYCSPLSRAIKTAEAIARQFGLAVQTHRGLTDINYGQWQGLTPDEARERRPEMVDAWYRTPETAQILGGETFVPLPGRRRGQSLRQAQGLCAARRDLPAPATGRRRPALRPAVVKGEWIEGIVAIEVAGG